MRFLVLGAGGMAGHLASIYLSEKGHDVVGLARRELPFLEESVVCDARDEASLRMIVKDGSFDAVVNLIGVLNAAADRDPAAAVFLNSYLPHMLAEATEGMPARVIHVSTDCVFAGNTGPYTEASAPDGRTMYDATKALGELKDDKNLTLRQSIVGPDINEGGIGLLNWFMAQQGSVGGYSNAMWTGLTTLELAKAVEQCAQDGSAGLVNMVPDSAISKLELLRLFNAHMRKDPVDIEPVEEPHLDKSLVRTNWSPSFEASPYEKQVEELAAWMRAHSELYPHYRLD